MSRVLVIDDEPKIVSFVTRALSARGYEVDSAGSGAEGLELIRLGGYAVVVLDLRLPDIDGIDVLRSTLEERPDQQVIVLSALPDVDTKVRCLDLGAADYITKPFSLTELIARVRRRVRQRASDGERFLRAGQLVLDLRNRAADVGDGMVSLAAREFMLLHHLVRHREEVCTREELLSDVWGYSFDPGTNAVDVCVRRLRAKLGANVIETIRNVGYSFHAS
jgi:two-component system copper resistance phosphate regulon response regulator CusR